MKQAREVIERERPGSEEGRLLRRALRPKRFKVIRLTARPLA
jgi:hypothetical protein